MLINQVVITDQPYSFTEHLVAGMACVAASGPGHHGCMIWLHDIVGKTYISHRAGREGFNLFIAASENANCQTMVSLTLASGGVPVMVGLRLFLPES